MRYPGGTSRAIEIDLRAGWLPLACLVLALAACNVDPFNLGAGGDGGVGDDAGQSDDGGGNGNVDAGMPADAAPTTDGCVPAPEVCDEVDNDCDGDVDEETDLSADPANCGSCGTVCSLPGAAGDCVNSACEYSCLSTFHDLNQDLDMQGSNGCEYGPCTASGDETCNGIDDDCDRDVDEEIMGLDSDPDNCGECFNQCIFVNVEQSQCNSSICEYTACLDDTDGAGGSPDGVPDYADLSATPAGCEYKCPVTPPLAQEECNGVDDDCDNIVDELPIAGLGDDCYPTGQSGCTLNMSTGLYECDGVCAVGQMVCNFGVSSCQGYTLPEAQEICDGSDHDCDGAPRNGFDTLNDPNNCGDSCIDCDLPNAIEGCSNGVCVVADCLPGFVNSDGMDSTGCDYECTPTGDEVCDGIDNDCDRLFDDDDPDLTVPAGLDCDIPGTICTNVEPTCSACSGGTSWRCDYSGVTGAETGACGVLAFQESLCDGVDGDCDTLTDESYPIDPASPSSDCDDGEIGVCKDEGKFICDPGDTSAVVCDVTDTVSFPGTSEECNGLDDDCDGDIDEDAPTDMQAIDADGDLTTDYFIMTYEASHPDATDTEQGGMTHRACSRPDVLPWRSVTRAEAEAACNGIGTGWRLCTAGEWQRSCEGPTGTAYPYGETYDGDACNGFDYDIDCTPPNDNQSVLATGFDYACPATAGTCVSADGVYDLSGNVKEWTGTEEPATSGFYQVRGGSYNNVKQALTCDNDFLTLDETTAFPNVGFRCCMTAP